MSGQLLLLPQFVGRPLSEARRAAHAVLIDLREGETLVMLGGMVPHGLMPLGAGQERTVSVLCFRLTASA